MTTVQEKIAEIVAEVLGVPVADVGADTKIHPFDIGVKRFTMIAGNIGAPFKFHLDHAEVFRFMTVADAVADIERRIKRREGK